MKTFFDTANVSDLKEGVALGVVDGVTTNPALIAKEKRRSAARRGNLRLVPGDVSPIEVVALDFEGMVNEGEESEALARGAGSRLCSEHRRRR